MRSGLTRSLIALLVVAALAGVGARDLAANRACSLAHPLPGDATPAWSPDGAAIAFSRVGQGRPGRVLTLRLRDRKLRTLGHGASPSWGPGRITYVRSFQIPAEPPREVPCPTASSPSQACLLIDSCNGLLTQGDLFVARPGATTRTRLTETRDSESSPVWSPDGRSIAYVGQAGLEILNLATRSRQRITNPTGWDAEPAWSPRGTEIAFARLVGDQTDIYAVDVRTRRERRITRTPGFDESDPSWSPNAKSIAFARRAGGGSVIVVARSDGSRPFGLAAGRDPAWSPRGRSIAFVRLRHGAASIALVDVRTERVTPLVRR